MQYFSISERSMCLGVSHLLLDISQNLFEVFGIIVGIKLILFPLHTDINQRKPQRNRWHRSLGGSRQRSSRKSMELYLPGVIPVPLFLFPTEYIYVSETEFPTSQLHMCSLFVLQHPTQHITFLPLPLLRANDNNEATLQEELLDFQRISLSNFHCCVFHNKSVFILLNPLLHNNYSLKYTWFIYCRTAASLKVRSDYMGDPRSSSPVSPR